MFNRAKWFERGSSSTTRIEAVAAFVVLLLATTFVVDHDAWSPDEPRVIELGRSVARGSLVVPLLDGTPFLEQPPLHAWLVALAFRLFGESAESARVVSAVMGAATVAMTWAFARELAGRRVAALAVVTLMASARFFVAAHWVVADTTLAFFVVSSGTAALLGLQRDEPRRRAAGCLLAYAFASLAYLTKGVVGIGLSGFAFVAVVAARRDARLLLRSHLWAAPLVFAAITGPYHFRLWQELGWAGLDELVVRNTLGRAAGAWDRPNHRQPWFFYLLRLPVELLPGTLFATAALARYVRRRGDLDAAARFAHDVPLAWVGFGLLALSLAASKRAVYLVPLAPAIATLAGLWLDRALERPDDLLGRHLARVVATLVLVAAAGVPIGAHALGVAGPRTWAIALLLGATSAATIFLAGGRSLSLAASSVGLAAGLALGSGPFVDWYDAQWRLGPFLRQAATLVPEGQPVHVLFANESQRGAVAFYAGRSVVIVSGVEDLARRIGRSRELYLIHFDKESADHTHLDVLRGPHEILVELRRPQGVSLFLVRYRS